MTIQLLRKLKKAKPSTAARPSAAEKEGPGVSTFCNIAQHAHAQRKAKRNGQARQNAAENGVQGLSPTGAIQLARTPKKAKPSAAARPSVAGKGFR